MEKALSSQHVDTQSKVEKKPRIPVSNIFGERIEIPDHNNSSNQELVNEYGELAYRERDEFGEWLDRHC